jgi:hypothetical protein
LDAFLLKIVVEERLGYPVQLLSDGQLADIGPGLRISDVNAGIYSALARGEADVYPEVVSCGSHALWPLRYVHTKPQLGARSDSQVWPSLEAEEYDVYVRRERSVTFFTAVFVPLFRLSVP